MHNLGAIKTLLQNNPADIRMEVIMADLVAEGLNMDTVIFISNSLFKRSFHFDIEEISELEFSVTGKKKLSLVLNRNGLYDQIPEDLFHQPLDLLNMPDKTGSIQEIKVQEEIERQSRLFFRPIEQEFYQQRIALEMEERQFLFETTGTLHSGIFDHLWTFPDFMDSAQKTKLGILMPVLHRISGNIPLVEVVMKHITGDDVRFIETSPEISDVSEPCMLGDRLLGISTILSGNVSTLQPGYRLLLAIPSISVLLDYLPGGKKRIIHEFLCDLLLPMDADVSFETHLPHAAALFLLEESHPPAGILNHSTIL